MAALKGCVQAAVVAVVRTARPEATVQVALVDIVTVTTWVLLLPALSLIVTGTAYVPAGSAAVDVITPAADTVNCLQTSIPSIFRFLVFIGG